MLISSRTPEGEPAICPVCQATVRVEPSLFFSDAPCQSCGCLLWFLRLGDQYLVMQPSEAARKKGIAKILADIVGIGNPELPSDPETFAELEIDSTGLVELVMHLEDEIES